jgi:hypothetical protein
MSRVKLSALGTVCCKSCTRIWVPEKELRNTDIKDGFVDPVAVAKVRHVCPYCGNDNREVSK